MLRLRTGDRDPLTCPRPSGTLSPKGARAVNVVWGKLKLICNICRCVRISKVESSCWGRPSWGKERTTGDVDEWERSGSVEGLTRSGKGASDAAASGRAVGAERARSASQRTDLLSKSAVLSPAQPQAPCPAVERGRRRRLTHTPAPLPFRLIERGHYPRLPRFKLLRYV